ncbi:MAG: tetratricopeptide repeat protein [Bacteroidia bacterium]
MNELATEIKSKKLPLSIDYAKQANQIAEANGFKKEIGTSSSTLGLLYSYTTLLDSAVYWNKKAINYLLPTKDSLEISKNYNRLGVNYILKSDYENAVKYLLPATTWSNTPKIKANAYNNLGMISKKNGNYAKAIQYYFSALQNYELCNTPISQATTFSNLGSLYIQKKDYKRAIEMYNQSYKIAVNINDSESLGQAFNGLGITTNRLGNPTKGLEFFKQSAAIFKNLGFKNEFAQQLINIADLNGELGKYKEAENVYYEAEKIFMLSNDSLNLSAVYNNLGDLFFKQNVLKKAASFFEKSYKYSSGFNDVNYKRLIVKNLSSIYQKLGQDKKALEYRIIYEEMYDKMVNVAEVEKIVELNHAYDSNKKEHQIIQKNEQITALQSSRKNIYIIIGILCFVVFFVLILYRSRLRKHQLLEENIQSIDKQIASLKIENSDLKTKLIETELELNRLEVKYSKDKEKLPETHTNLSNREYEVLLFMAEGLGDKEIADKIFVSVTTVRTHIRRIYDKLLVKNRTEAILMLNRFQLKNEAA